MADPWLVIPRPLAGARLRLFCFPYAGGSPSIFRGWPERLPAGVELCAVQYPGRGARLRESPFSKMPALIPALAAGLDPFFDRPFAFFGHSLGGLVSFELARALRRRGRPLPRTLFISGCAAPQRPYAHPPAHALPDGPFLENLRGLNGTPAEILDNRELMEILLPALRADFALHETYAYAAEPPLDCPIVVFGGRTDPRVDLAELDGWRAQTAGSFSRYMFPGDHFFLHSDEALLLPALAARLEAVR